jgi:aspartate-alanine antiporter
MEWLHHIFQKSPEAALFLSLAVGYAFGKIKFGKFQFGGVAGSLIAAVIISQVGVQIDNGVKSIMFALFIYAVGYESGPQFFNSLNRTALREIAMAVFMALAGLVTVLIVARLFGLDKGLAAGLAAGGMTQSAIIGTAGDAIAQLGLSAEETKRLQGNVAVGYAVTYIFGSFGAIVICVNILEKFMGKDLRTASLEVEAKLSGGVPKLGPGQTAALPALVGRIFRMEHLGGQTVRQVEGTGADNFTIERIRRGAEVVDPKPDYVLQNGDEILVVGRRDSVVDLASRIGTELPESENLSFVMHSRKAVFTRAGMNHKTIAEVREAVDRDLRHGLYIQRITRADQPLPVLPSTVVEHGDVITFYGSDSDTARAVKAAGYPLAEDGKTDFVYMGLGVLVGLLVGMLVAHVGGIPLTLGSGGGALLSGLLFGWARSKHPMVGAMPSEASALLRDFGLASFVAIVGLNTGLQAVETIKTSGAVIFLAGVIVTVVPLLLTMLFGRFVLRYDNAAVLAGALSGSRSANPAFGEILGKSGSSVPTVPFAVTYAMANVLLTLLGPLIIGLS